MLSEAQVRSTFATLGKFCVCGHGVGSHRNSTGAIAKHCRSCPCKQYKRDYGNPNDWARRDPSDTEASEAVLEDALQQRHVKMYSYNHDYKPPLVEAVRNALRYAPGPLTLPELMNEVNKYAIASYDTHNAVQVILGRMHKRGEIFVTLDQASTTKAE